jgi:hypothetical protein
VRVISVDPGDMHTEMHMAADPEANPDDLFRPEDVAERLVTLLAGRVPAVDRVEAAGFE